MNNNTVSKVAAWVGTAIAVSVALYFTKNPICLWAFAFPMIAMGAVSYTHLTLPTTERV